MLPAEYYTSQEIFGEELERIFGCPLALCRVMSPS